MKIVLTGLLWNYLHEMRASFAPIATYDGPLAREKKILKVHIE